MNREPYRGTSRKLLLSFDVGTTFSGVSYSIMDPGDVPVIRPVTRFPSQEQSGGDCKIPSILYYDRYGAIKAVGAEAIREGIEDTAKQQGWMKAEWFKLHLRPTVGSMSLGAFQGAVFVTTRAKAHLEKLLRGSDYEEDIDSIAKAFDTKTKLTFRNSTDPQFIKFGSPRYNDPDLGIRFGQLKLGGTEVASFFQPSVQSIINGVKEQRNKSQYTTKTVLLVGGFAASDWLHAQVTSSLRLLGVEVFRPEGYTGKPVAYGGASYYLDRRVKSRTSKAAYGTDFFGRFDPSKTTHLTRRHQLEKHPLEGYMGFGNMFRTILDKDISVLETQEFRRSFTMSYRSLSGIGNASVAIVRYQGPPAEDLWIGTESNTWDTLCSIEVDARRFPTSSAIPAGGFSLIYRVSFDVIIRFGLTELQAQVAWKEPGGAESRTTAKIVYG